MIFEDHQRCRRHPCQRHHARSEHLPSPELLFELLQQRSQELVNTPNSTMSDTQLLQRPGSSRGLDGDVPKPFDVSDIRLALERNDQHYQENRATDTEQNTKPLPLRGAAETLRNVPQSHWSKAVQNNTHNGSVNGAAIKSQDPIQNEDDSDDGDVLASPSKCRARVSIAQDAESDEKPTSSPIRLRRRPAATDTDDSDIRSSPRKRQHDRNRPEEEKVNKSEVKPPTETINDVATPKSEIKLATGAKNALHPESVHILASGSLNRDAKNTGDAQANGTVTDEMRCINSVGPNSLSTSIPLPPQNLEATREAKQVDEPGPPSPNRKDAPTVEDNSTHAATAGPINAGPSHRPLNTVSEKSIGSRFSDAHEVTGEPIAEVSRIRKKSRIFWVSSNEFLNNLSSKAREVFPNTRSHATLLENDVVEVDSLKLLRNVPLSAKDNKNFERFISEKLESLICVITFDGPEEMSSTVQELKMIVTKDGKVTPCIVISCASQHRTDDVKKRLKSELKYFDLYSLPWEVICDPKRFDFLAPSAASNRELSSIEMQGYFVTTTLDKNTNTNNWDRCAGAPLYVFPKPVKGEAVDTSRYLALCTLGGFIEVADGIYGLT